MDNTRRDSEPNAPTPAGQYNPASSDPSPDDHSPSSGQPTDLSATGGRRTLSPEPPPTRGGGLGKWLVLLALLALGLVAFLLFRRSGEHEQLATETRQANVQNVSVTRPSEGPTANEIILPGNLTAYSEASIFARTSGYIKAWYVDIGAKVAEGQVLAEIEAPDVDAQLRQATATLAQAKSNLEIANLNFDRQKDLLAKKVASQQEYDQNRTNVDAMKAAVQADEASVQNLTVQKDFQGLKSPFAGVVTKRNTDVGALISASSGGQELFRVARTDILRVYVYVPQAYAAYVKEGSTAFLDLVEFPGEKFSGKVAHIAGAMDPATRTLQTEVEIDNKDGRLFPGSFANTHLLLPLKKAPMVVPVNAFLFRSQGLQVAIVDKDGVVHLRKVTIGQDFGTTLEIADGVTREDRLIINPSDSLQDGAKVEVQEATPKDVPKGK